MVTEKRIPRGTDESSPPAHLPIRSFLTDTFAQSRASYDSSSVATKTSLPPAASRSPDKPLMLSPAFHSSSPSVAVSPCGTISEREASEIQPISMEKTPYANKKDTMFEKRRQVDAFPGIFDQSSSQDYEGTSDVAIIPRLQNVTQLRNQKDEDAYDDASHRLVIAAELAPDDDVADRLEKEINEAVEARLSEHHQKQVIAEAVVVDAKSKSLFSTDPDSNPLCNLSRRTLVFILLLIALVATLIVFIPSDVKKMRKTLGNDIIRTDADEKHFDNSETPQWKALKWMSTDKNILHYEKSTLLNRYVLTVLYYSTDGDNWNNKNVSFLSKEDVCRWNNDERETEARGYSCSGESIELQGVGLSGTLPWELSLLSGLKVLNMNSNSLRGTVPSELRKLSNLLELNLSNNSFHGSLPLILSSTIEEIDLSNNLFSGNIPTKSGIELQGVDLSGINSGELSTLSNLKILNMNSNNLNGTVPSELSDLSNLSELNLSNNSFHGSLPVILPSTLKKIDFSENSFSGSIPSEWGMNLSNISWVALGSNQLAGRIPTELSQLTTMKSLAIGQNRLTGPLPSELGQLSSLTSLWMSNNKMIGTIPTEFKNLQKLKNFAFDKNSFHGHVQDILCMKNSNKRSWASLESDCLEGNYKKFLQINCTCCTKCCTPIGDTCKTLLAKS